MKNLLQDQEAEENRRTAITQRKALELRAMQDEQLEALKQSILKER